MKKPKFPWRSEDGANSQQDIVRGVRRLIINEDQSSNFWKWQEDLEKYIFRHYDQVGLCVKINVEKHFSFEEPAQEVDTIRQNAVEKANLARRRRILESKLDNVNFRRQECLKRSSDVVHVASDTEQRVHTRQRTQEEKNKSTTPTRLEPPTSHSKFNNQTAKLNKTKHERCRERT